MESAGRGVIDRPTSLERPGPCLGAGQGRRGGRLSQRRDKPAAHARWPARFRGVSVTWRDAPPRHGATALPGHPASVPPPDESSSPQRRPPQVRQLAAVTERSASRPEAGYQQTDPSEVSWAGRGLAANVVGSTKELKIAPISSGKQKANTGTMDRFVGVPNGGSCSPLNKQAIKAKSEASIRTTGDKVLPNRPAPRCCPAEGKSLPQGWAATAWPLKGPASEARPRRSPVPLLPHSRCPGGLGRLFSDTGALRAPVWAHDLPGPAFSAM